MRGRRMKFIKSPHQKHWLTENNKSSLRRSWFALKNCCAFVNRPIVLAVSSTQNVSWRRAEVCFLEFYPHKFLLFCSPQSEMKPLSIWETWGMNTKTEGRYCCPPREGPVVLVAHTGQPVQKPVRGWMIQWLSVCSLSAKEERTFPGQVILSIAIKQLWKIHIFPKLALTLQFHIYVVTLSSKYCAVKQKRGMERLYFHFLLVFSLFVGFQRKFRQSKSGLLVSWSTKARSKAGCSKGSCVSCAVPLQHPCVAVL